MNWFKKKEICIHCNENKTKREFENQPTCPECRIKILVARESTRICPVDGSILLKEHNNEIIIDRCPKCKGIWLDPGEIEAIKEVALSQGLATGMMF
ncbi:MAG: zf-TFIIB domain-containing protein [Cellulophaga sp.]